MALLPELLRFRQSIDTHLLPPFLFSAKIMERAMMDHAERQGPFIAHLTAERARLGETQMMRVAGRAGPTIALVLGDIFRGKSSHRLPAGTRGATRPFPTERRSFNSDLSRLLSHAR
jgi:hypothetical protein